MRSAERAVHGSRGLLDHWSLRPACALLTRILTRWSWNLLRYPWHALDGDPAGCVAEIEETRALAAHRPA